MFALEDKLGPNVSKGRITIEVTSLSDPDKLEVAVSDNGIGLDGERYAAFCEIDTDFKKAKGGKGVGRLFWLDAFTSIRVDSRYLHHGSLLERAFNFVLNNFEQVVPLIDGQQATAGSKTGTTVRFGKLRTTEYAETFPRRADTFLRYFSAHFIADFLMGGGPKIMVNLDGDITEYPKAVAELVVGEPLKATFNHKEFGEISIVGFTCLAEASTGLEGRHQLHLLANERTVETRKVDNLLGLESLTRDDQTDLVFHGCISSEYLNLRVNEGRTAFNLTERTLKEISRVCMDAVRDKLLPEQVRQYMEKRRNDYSAFVERYASSRVTSVSRQCALTCTLRPLRTAFRRIDAMQSELAIIEPAAVAIHPSNAHNLVVRRPRGPRSIRSLAFNQPDANRR
ncbi:MAG TPA: hypothetical protein PLN33_18025, partial [Hyphomonadaceae bacterium]|nr:hypothetical protein [Hyphomonadaceae bacterium]